VIRPGIVPAAFGLADPAGAAGCRKKVTVLRRKVVIDPSE